ARSPLIERFEKNHRFEHGERRWIGGRFGLAGFAKDPLDFGNLAKNAILNLEHARGFVDGHAWNSRRHVEKGAFIERRHEFFVELIEWDGIAEKSIYERNERTNCNDQSGDDEY